MAAKFGVTQTIFGVSRIQKLHYTNKAHNQVVNYI